MEIGLGNHQNTSLKTKQKRKMDVDGFPHIIRNASNRTSTSLEPYLNYTTAHSMDFYKGDFEAKMLSEFCTASVSSIPLCKLKIIIITKIRGRF